MKQPVIRRRRARLDIEEAAFWYAVEADTATAERFIAAVETAMTYIARHPEAGSLRHADLSVHGDLRFWPLRAFPWLVFYRLRPDHIDVWRVLHAERDFPQWLHDQE